MADTPTPPGRPYIQPGHARPTADSNARSTNGSFRRGSIPPDHGGGPQPPHRGVDPGQATSPGPTESPRTSSWGQVAEQPPMTLAQTIRNEGTGCRVTEHPQTTNLPTEGRGPAPFQMPEPQHFNLGNTGEDAPPGPKGPPDRVGG